MWRTHTGLQNMLMNMKHNKKALVLITAYFLFKSPQLMPVCLSVLRSRLITSSSTTTEITQHTAPVTTSHLSHNDCGEK